MSTATKRVGLGVIAMIILLALLVTTLLVLTGDKKADAADAAKDGNPASTASLNKEAATWVRLLYVNFKGSDEVPDEITNWKSPEDLSTVHFYNKETNKESKTAFGPDMGNTPEKVSTNIVERLYRDPALLATVARDLKLTSFENSEQAKVISDLENDAAKRRALANKVLGWYANPDLELTIEKHKGAYSSDEMSGSGTTSSVNSDGTSNVLTATDEKSGKVMSQRRLDCGWQVFKPKPPKSDCKHNCTPPCVEIPGNGVADCSSKDPSKSTQSQGNNKPGGGGAAPTQTDSQGPPAAGNPPPTYSPPPAPAPKPTPRPTPPPPAEGGDDSGNNDNSGDPGAP